MKIYLPAHCIQTGRIGGVEQVIYGLYRGFISGGHEIYLASDEPERLAPEFRSIAVSSPSRPALKAISGKTRFLGEQLSYWADGTRGDLAIFPNYYTPLLHPKRAQRVFTILHDVQYAAFPEYFSVQKRAWLRRCHRKTLDRADAVVAISDYVRSTILNTYGKIHERTVQVIHNPIDWSRFDSSCGDNLRGLREDRPYLLSVAANFPHKNLGTLVRMFAELSKETDVDLVFVGQFRENLGRHSKGGDDIETLINELEVEERVIQTGFVSDGELAQLYRRASVFLFPSVYEGFGMPAIEAIGLGVPTVTTNRTAIPEVTMGKAVYVNDPFDIREWKDKVDQILRTPTDFQPDYETIQDVRKRYAPSTIASAYVSLVETIL